MDGFLYSASTVSLRVITVMRKKARMRIYIYYIIDNIFIIYKYYNIIYIKFNYLIYI